MVGAEYPLDQAATALTALTTRRTTGKIILRMTPSPFPARADSGCVQGFGVSRS
ncbi:hypothetical protein [Nonomuraea rubra]|uniref:hypothetical protein n=1 Tax=Nonomuraea rubra TaxID=46180 RepID=UPI0033DBA3A0